MQRAIATTLDQARGPLIASGMIGMFVVALLGVLRFGLPIWSLLIIVLGIAYIFAVIHKPFIGLMAVVALFFFQTQLPLGVSLLQAVGGGTAMLVLLWFLYERRRIVFGSIQIPLALLGILIVTSLWFSLDLDRTVFYFSRWVFNMMFVGLMLNLVTTFAVFKRVVWTVVIMAAVNSAFGMFDYAGASEFNFRSSGLMQNANSYGHLAALALPLALYQYLYGKGAVRLVGLILSAVLLGGVVSSVSRGAVVSVLVTFVFILFRERRRAIPLLLVVAFALAVTPLLPEYYKYRVGSLATDVKMSLDVSQDRGLTSRGSLNKAGLKIWAAHPILGVGIGNFGYYYTQHEFVEELRGDESRVAHNIYVQALAEMGLFGAAVLGWLLVSSGRSVWRARKASQRGSVEWVYFGSIESMAFAIFISTATYGNLMYNDFWMFIALTAISSRVALAGKDRPEIRQAEATA